MSLHAPVPPPSTLLQQHSHLICPFSFSLLRHSLPFMPPSPISSSSSLFLHSDEREEVEGNRGEEAGFKPSAGPLFLPVREGSIRFSSPPPSFLRLLISMHAVGVAQVTWLLDPVPTAGTAAAAWRKQGQQVRTMRAGGGNKEEERQRRTSSLERCKQAELLGIISETEAFSLDGKSSQIKLTSSAFSPVTLLVVSVLGKRKSTAVSCSSCCTQWFLINISE